MTITSQDVIAAQVLGIYGPTFIFLLFVENQLLKIFIKYMNKIEDEFRKFEHRIIRIKHKNEIYVKNYIITLFCAGYDLFLSLIITIIFLFYTL